MSGEQRLYGSLPIFRCHLFSRRQDIGLVEPKVFDAPHERPLNLIKNPLSLHSDIGVRNLLVLEISAELQIRIPRIDGVGCVNNGAASLLPEIPVETESQCLLALR